MRSLLLSALFVYANMPMTEGIAEYAIQDLLLCGSSFNMTFVNASAVRLQLTSHGVYWKGLDCAVTISSLGGEKLMLYFEDMAIEETSTCSNDWLEIYDGDSVQAPYISGLLYRQCGFSAPSGVYHTSRNYLTLKMTSNQVLEYRGFDMIITRYHDGFCKPTDFYCKNGRCIDGSLVCNGHNPCGDHSDCPGPDPAHVGDSLVLHVGGLVGIAAASVVIIAIVVVVIVLMTRRRRQRMYRERIVTVESSTSYGTRGECPSQPVTQHYQEKSPLPK